jgi:excisionase family DNA binding protein
MAEKARPSQRQRSATSAKTVEPASGPHERTDNPPAWALDTHQNADADELRSPRQALKAAVPSLLWSRMTSAPLMTIKDAATLLRVSTKTIRRLIAREELQAVRVGRSVRLRSADVFRIIEHGQ